MSRNDNKSLMSFLSQSERDFYKKVLGKPLNKRTLDEELKRQAMEKVATARWKAWRDKHFDD